MKRICLISPGHLSTNPRLVKEAQALKQAGYAVSLIHGRFKSWGTENDAWIAKELGETISVPFGPLEAPRLTYVRQSLIRHGARALLRASWTFPSLIERAHHPIVGDLIAAALASPADLYIAHYVAALPAAAKAAERYGARFAFDAEDFHLGDLPDLPAHDLEKQIIRMIEGRYLPDAAYVSAASPMIAQGYSEAYGIALATTILNVFPRRHAPSSPTRSGAIRPGPSLYWCSQTIGPGRGLEVALEAISRAVSAPHLYLRGSISPDYHNHLYSLALKAGVAERLHILPPAAPDVLEKLGAEYDLGYSGETGFSQNNQRALANKLFSYLLSGVPIVASDVPAHRAIVDDFGSAMRLFANNDPVALASAIDALLLDPARLGAARTYAWHLGQEQFNWDIEKTKLLTLVDQALTPH